MARTVTLTELLTRIRALADTRDITINDAVLTDWINELIAELRDVMVDVNQDYYVTENAAVAITSGTGKYAFATIAADFYKIRGVDVLSTTGEWVKLQECRESDRNRLQGGAANKEDTRYRAVDVNLELYPTPNWDGTVRFRYIPHASKLVNPADTLNTINGYDSYVVYGVVALCAAAQEEDPSIWLGLQAKAEARVLKAVKVRNAAEPPRVRSTKEERLRAARPDLFLPRY